MEENNYSLKLKKLSSFIQTEYCLLILFIILSVSLLKNDVNDITLSIGIISSALILIVLVLTPLLIASFFGKRQFNKNKKNIIWCWFFGIISFFITQYFIYYVFTTTDEFTMQIGSIILLEIPNILYIYYCYKIS